MITKKTYFTQNVTYSLFCGSGSQIISSTTCIYNNNVCIYNNNDIIKHALYNVQSIFKFFLGGNKSKQSKPEFK